MSARDPSGAGAKGRTVPPAMRLGQAALAVMIEEATVDAHDEDEQATGWFTMFEEHVELPFTTRVLGVDVTVKRIELRDHGELVAVCTRGKDRLAILLVDLPLPSPRPHGAEWIAAYASWHARR